MSFEDKILLITGGTGTFGNAVINRLLSVSGIKEIRVFSRDEKKQDDARHFYKSDKLKFYIGDVRNRISVLEACEGVDYIFHAAALKQVPSCEFFPIEAVNTNVLGADNVLSAAIANNVKNVVVLSTDKAVYPINAMGMTKALMEKTMIAKSRSSKTVICGTRYGNVVGSRGSVVPLFIEQIKSKQPITITNSDMTRFMMSIENAVDLVFFAMEHGTPGDIYVQKSPACTIENIAKALKIIFKSNTPIAYIGIRHGEKMYESLLTREEKSKAIDLGRYYRVPADDRDLNYDNFLTNGNSLTIHNEGYTSNNTNILSLEETVVLLENFMEVNNVAA